MKDKIFIIWSGRNAVALKVKQVLENKYNYICYVGGNHQNDSQMLSVGDTVVRQMNSCNQAIVIFENKNNGDVSDNLFFELGYVSAKYGMKKVHCVKKETDVILLPSDFDNSFIENIHAEDDNAYIEGIVEYFIGRQKLSVDTNKMYLINNRYIIHEMIQTHYSEIGSKCSDYELAQYILFYTQSGEMFRDEVKILDELRQFKKHHNGEFSIELHKSINMCIALLEVASNLVNDKDAVYITDKAFRSYFNVCKDMLDELHDDDAGTFDEWAKAIVAENLTFVCALYAANPTLPDSLRKQLFTKVISFGKDALMRIEILENSTPCVENNDNVGLISLLKAYVYRHLFNANRELGSSEAEKWLKLSLKEHQELLRVFDINSIDTKIYNNLEMEYYVILSEYLDYIKKENMDDFEYMMYMSDIDNFISKYQSRSDIHAFIQKIVYHRNKILENV